MSSALVSELMDIHGSWDHDLVHQFLPLDAHEILKVRPCTRSSDDVLSWAGEKNGNFSVKSAYRIAFDERTRNDQESSSSAPGGDRSC